MLRVSGPQMVSDGWHHEGASGVIIQCLAALRLLRENGCVMSAQQMGLHRSFPPNHRS